MGMRTISPPASTAESFLFHYAEKNDYDILLLDIEMGDMDGVTMAKRLRRDNDTIQIVFITGYSDYISDRQYTAGLHPNRHKSLSYNPFPSHPCLLKAISADVPSAVFQFDILFLRHHALIGRTDNLILVNQLLHAVRTPAGNPCNCTTKRHLIKRD